MNPYLKWTLIVNVVFIDLVFAYMAFRVLLSYLSDRAAANQVKQAMEQMARDLGGTFTEIEPGVFAMKVPAVHGGGSYPGDDDGTVN